MVVTTKSPRDKKKCESERLEWYIARIVHLKRRIHNYIPTYYGNAPTSAPQKCCFLRVFTKMRRVALALTRRRTRKRRFQTFLVDFSHRVSRYRLHYVCFRDPFFTRQVLPRPRFHLIVERIFTEIRGGFILVRRRDYRYGAFAVMFIRLAENRNFFQNRSS